MALNIKQVKKNVEVTCPLFTDREKGDWNELENSTVTVDGAIMYTDSNGDTYGVITVKEIPGAFFLCGSVATKIIEEVMKPENGGTFDSDGILRDEFKIFVGEMKQGKNKGKSAYRVVSIAE